MSCNRDNQEVLIYCWEEEFVNEKTRTLVVVDL